MFRPVDDRAAIWPLLSGLIGLVVWSSAIAWPFCPHTIGSFKHCYREASAVPSDSRIHDNSEDHMHCAGMAETSMPATASRVSHVDIPNGVEAKLTSESNASDFVNSGVTYLKRFESRGAEMLTQSSAPCSHCMMHSDSGPISRLKVLAADSSSYLSLTPSPVTVATLVSARHPFVDIDDHGPPGLNGSRCILNSSLRI